MMGAKNVKVTIDREEYKEIISRVRNYEPANVKENQDIICQQIQQRTDAINESIHKTVEGSKHEINDAIRYFRDWMLNGAIVRVLGAGRAKLAAAIPANRLAHGGARVYIQDEIIPMPHSIKGGGIIAVSASGKTPSVIEALKSLKNKDERIKRIGIAQSTADKDFIDNCHIFIGIKGTDIYNPLQALADTSEYVISMLLDAMVVAAGKLAGYDDAKWRLGHEDIGPTGPYDYIPKLGYEKIMKYADALG
jgi:D-arabinose 5-phosphate isomerase GutQ